MKIRKPKKRHSVCTEINLELEHMESWADVLGLHGFPEVRQVMYLKEVSLYFCPINFNLCRNIIIKCCDQKTPQSRGRTSSCILFRLNAALRSNMNMESSRALRLEEKRHHVGMTWLLHHYNLYRSRDPAAQEGTRFAKIGLGQVLGRKTWTLRTRTSSAIRKRFLVNSPLWDFLQDRQWWWDANRNLPRRWLSNPK